MYAKSISQMHGIWGRIDSKIYMGGHACVSNRDWVTLHGTVLYTYSKKNLLLFGVLLLADDYTARIEITEYSVEV